MTPPLPSGSIGSPTKLSPLPGVSDSDAAAPISKPSFKVGDSYVPLDNSSDRYPTTQDLLNAIGDEQLFGTVANAKYQPERNKKYLKVTLAIMEVKKYLRGDEKNYGYATKKIEEWLSDSELLTDTVVAHQARVNLIKALKRAPKSSDTDEGVKAIIEALSKNYATAPVPPPAKPDVPKVDEKPKVDAPKVDEKPVVAASLNDALVDAKIFGDKFSSYDSERNKKYLDVTVALIEIRKIAKGTETSPVAAKAKIASWLSDPALLTDPVAHKARLGLIQALTAAPKGSDVFNQAIAEVLAALKADYSKAGAAPKVEAKPVTEIKAKEAGGKLGEVSVNPKSKPKEARVDDAKSFSAGLQSAVKPAITRLMKKYSSVSVKTQMMVSIDESTGQIITVSFKDNKLGDVSPQDAKELFAAIADNIRSRFRFKKIGNEGLAFISVPLSVVGQ
ncbi:MAG: hypothetical protein K8R69_10560 [Deltaproteobacteria bacterium]|nr:hypothetical protein [Deltaproteobacteria bacterium]